MSFEQFVEKQCEKMAAECEALGISHEEWIERNAEQFRNENPVVE